MDESVKIARRELAKTVNSFMNTIHSKIKDSDGMVRETIFVSDTTVADITHAVISKKTRVDPNPFNATLVVLEGGVDIAFDSGDKAHIDEKNRSISVPKFVGFTAVGSGGKNAIITIVDQHER